MRTREELLRAWVDALESGKYEQARGALRVHDTYCCLGVACDISDMGTWRGPTVDGETKWSFMCEEYIARNYLPLRLQKRMVVTERDQSELIAANDDGETFPDIAQRIRNMFPDVFATVST